MTMAGPTYVESETVAIIESGPAISWGAVIAGAIAAAAISMVLLAVGAAFGLSMVSPWESGEAAEDAATTVGIGAVVYLLLVHAISSGFGGYVAGRLRKKLIGVRGDETYFRDTAHGMLVWALSTVVGLLILVLLSAQLIGGGLAAGAAGIVGPGGVAGATLSQTGPAAATTNAGIPGGLHDLEAYYADSFFRPPAAAGAAPASPGTDTTGTSAAPDLLPAPTAIASEREDRRREVARILRMGLMNGEVSAEDKAYMAQLVSQETGLPPAEASRRVDEVIGQTTATVDKLEATARDAAEKARVAARAGAIWSAIAMLVGALSASLAATWGGRARDSI
jgi:hypothetical protein